MALWRAGQRGWLASFFSLSGMDNFSLLLVPPPDDCGKLSCKVAYWHTRESSSVGKGCDPFHPACAGSSLALEASANEHTGQALPSRHLISV